MNSFSYYLINHAGLILWNWRTFLFRLRHTYGGFDKIKIIQGSKFQDAQLETGAKKHPCLTWHNHLMEESGFKDRLQITSGYTDKYEQLLVELETLLANLGILWCVSVRILFLLYSLCFKEPAMLLFEGCTFLWFLSLLALCLLLSLWTHSPVSVSIGCLWLTTPLCPQNHFWFQSTCISKGFMCSPPNSGSL